MRTWNDLYKMLKNGEMDQSLIQTGCEDINAYRNTCDRSHEWI